MGVGRSLRLRALLACVLIAAPCLAFIRTGSAEGSGSARLVVTPVADAYVSSSRPGRSFGTAAGLRVAAAPVARSYLSFRLNGTAPVTRAMLRVYVLRGAGPGFKVVSAGTNPVGERRLTFRNAPGTSSTGPLSGRVRAGRWVSVDVTALIAGRGVRTIGLVGLGGKPIELGSRESRGRRPQLAITFGPADLSLPIRLAFYYPWFPNAWKQRGMSPYTKYTPSAGTYDSGDVATIRRHIEAMRYGKIQAGLASWWGRAHHTDSRLPRLFEAADALGGSFRWGIYYEAESRGDPSEAEIRADLTYLRDRFGGQKSALRIDGRFVVFVYTAGSDGCPMAERWKRANTVGAYVVLKVFPSFRTCPSQPDGWHQYAPALDSTAHLPWAVSISPGFYLAEDAQPRLTRDVSRWNRNIRDLVASRARFQLVTTFNEWGEGTAVESAREWASASGYGAYLDALHTDGRGESVPAQPPPPPASPPPQPVPPPGPNDPVVVGVGDIACDPTSGNFNGGNGTARNCREKATSDLALAIRPDAVLTLGDTQYEDNTYSKFMQSFDRSWGRLKPLIRPAPGNHEYLTAKAAGYFQYFGAAAGDPAKGYYSYDLGRWHLIVLNSQCSAVGGCHRGSAQESWLRSDLAAHRNRCVLAYWHHPRFTSGQHGAAQGMATIWNDLAEARADVVLTGHNHVYERFDPIGSTPQTSEEYQHPSLDPNGIRYFVVGTGGKNLTRFEQPPLTGEVVRNSDTFGVLKLTLRPAGYDWAFVPEPGKSFTDSGSGRCSP